MADAVDTELKTVLDEHKIRVTDYFAATHALFTKSPLYKRPKPPVGIVLHNTSGLIALENVVTNLKNSLNAYHFMIARDGSVGRFVHLDYADRATENTNLHISIEFQAIENGGIEEEQVKSAGIIAGVLNAYYGCKLVVATAKTDPGIAYHAMFVDPKNPKAHTNCPGAAIYNRRKDIIEQALPVAARLVLPGQWEVQIHPWLYIYEFRADGSVSWKWQTESAASVSRGSGTWKVDGGHLSISWAPGSKTKEQWDLPLNPAEQTGNCTTDTGTRPLGVVWKVVGA